MKKISTKVTKILDFNHIDYELFTYSEERLSGIEIATILKEDPKLVFKTLLTKDNKNKFHIFVIPVNKELDLKKAASLANVKKLDMIPVKEITKVTGYVRGGCCPLAMKKRFRTFIDQTVLNKKYIYCSGGKIGLQIRLDPKNLIQLLSIVEGDISK